MKIAKVFGILLVIFFSSLVVLSFQQEQAREAMEEDEYCNAYAILKWTSYLTRESKRGLARLFAGGLCVDQDINVAKNLYESLVGNDPQKIGKELFYSALRASDADERMNSTRRDKVLQNLFLESSKLNFKLTEREIKLLDSKNLSAVYNDAVLKN